ncbi:MAG TPA: hypothetical protein VMF91_26435 [Bryobacteraceae bacterium]|nr:hypothetical protein [Bryobacteraceae bacterium]
MTKLVITMALACASTRAQVAVELPNASAQRANRVVEWNRNPLALLRTPDARATAPREEAIAGQFWSEGIQKYWNGIAQRATAVYKSSSAPGGPGTLREGVNAFYEAKYTYTFWRSVTALRADQSLSHPDTDNLNWVPKAASTASDPSYLGTQAAIVAFHFHTRCQGC